MGYLPYLPYLTCFMVGFNPMEKPLARRVLYPVKQW